MSCGGHRAGSHAQGKLPDLRTLSCTGERGSYPPCSLIPPPHVERTRGGGPLPSSTLEHEALLGKQFDLDFFSCRGSVPLPPASLEPPAPRPPPQQLCTSWGADLVLLGGRDWAKLGVLGLELRVQPARRPRGKGKPPLTAPLLRFLVPPVSSPPPTVVPLQSEA